MTESPVESGTDWHLPTHPQRPNTTPSIVRDSPTHAELKSFCELLEKWAGLKPFSSPAQLKAREALLIQLTREHGFASIGEMIDRLRSDPIGPLAWRVLGRATVGETHFFRHPAQFAELQGKILPELIEARAGTTRTLEIWSAGCSTGEEVYSLAIVLHRLLKFRPEWRISLVGSDLSLESLECARLGRYSHWSFRSTSSFEATRFFRRLGDLFVIEPGLRRVVRLAHHNLISGAPPPMPLEAGKIDLIVCRNVLIYFSRRAIERVLHQFEEALAPDGVFLPGPSEAPFITDLGIFQEKVSGQVTFYVKKGCTERRSLPFHSDQKPSCSTIGPGTQKAAPSDGGPEIPSSCDSLRPSPTRPTTTPARSVETVNLPPNSPPCPPGGPPSSESSTVGREQLLKKAWHAANQGELTRCLDLVAGAIALCPLDPEAHLLKGLILQDLGKTTEAIATLQRCVFLRWDLVLAHFYLGRLLLRTGDRKRGASHLRTVRALASCRAPDEPVLYSDDLTCGRLVEQVENLAPDDLNRRKETA